MESIAEWLAKISWPLVSRVMVSMGIGTATYTGADSALTGALNAVKQSFSALTSDLLNLLLLSGFFDAMAIMSGGLVSGLTWMVLKRFAVMTTGPAS